LFKRSASSLSNSELCSNFLSFEKAIVDVDDDDDDDDDAAAAAMDELKERVLREMAELERDRALSAEEREIKMAQHMRSLDKLAASEQRRLKNAREQHNSERQSPATLESSTSVSTQAPTERSTEEARKQAEDAPQRGCVIQ
jgi:hypothetical protein